MKKITFFIILSVLLFSCTTARKFHRYGEEHPKEAIKFIEKNYPNRITGSDTIIEVIDSTFIIGIDNKEKNRLIDSAIKAIGIDDSLVAIYSLGLDEGYQIGFESAKQKYFSQSPKTIVKTITTRIVDSAQVKKILIELQERDSKIEKLEKKIEDKTSEIEKLTRKVKQKSTKIIIFGSLIVLLLIIIFRKPIFKLIALI